MGQRMAVEDRPHADRDGLAVDRSAPDWVARAPVRGAKARGAARLETDEQALVAFLDLNVKARAPQKHAAGAVGRAARGRASGREIRRLRRFILWSIAAAAMARRRASSPSGARGSEAGGKFLRR